MNNKHDYLPAREAELLVWTGQFLTNITDRPGEYGLNSVDAANYRIVYDQFFEAYERAQLPATRTRPVVEVKNVAKAALLRATRSLVEVIQACPMMTNEKRKELSITERRRRSKQTPVPPAPVIKVCRIDGRRVTLELQQHGSTTGRPSGAIGANIFIRYGEVRPATKAEWVFETGTGRSRFTLDLNGTRAAGRVWITGFWINRRMEAGQSAEPISVELAATPTLPQDASLKVAA